MGLFYVAVGTFLAMGVAVLIAQIYVRCHRRSGRYPAKGKMTSEEVRRLALSGEHFLAIRAYRELSGASLKDAKAFVEEIEKGPPGSTNSSGKLRAS